VLNIFWNKKKKGVLFVRILDLPNFIGVIIQNLMNVKKNALGG
jgi:hypothetical protein